MAGVRVHRVGARAAAVAVKLGAALLLAGALGCASAHTDPPLPARAPARAVGASSTLDQLLRGDLADDHAFPWSATRPLTWDDFQGTPPTEGPEGAKTSYTLYYAWKCR